MSNYSKLIGALVGNIVAIAIAYLASRGWAECTAIDGVEACAVLGFSQAQITGALMALFNMAFVYWFPPNKPA